MSALTTEAAELIVHVDHIDNARGVIRAALHDTETGYLGKDEAHAFRRASTIARMSDATFRFDDVPPGKYAIKVFHDENGNEKLDRNFFGSPTEPYGISNNARSRFSLPPFRDALISVEGASTEIRIELARQ